MENKTTTALITGASSGIGFELARCFARDNARLIMVAHYTGKLNEAAARLREEFPEAQLETIALDLSKDNAPEMLFSEIRNRGIQVDTLVNNAGFGEYGLFAQSDLEKEIAMIHLNIISLVHLTKLFLPEMLNRDAGRILQVASVASFTPAPLQSVYGATKAFILSFSEAIQEELKKSNVKVSILCPPATDTNFFNVAGAQDSKIAHGTLATAEEVAKAGYKGLLKGEARVIPTIKGKLSVIASTILPDSVAATAMHNQSEEIKGKKTTARKPAASKTSVSGSAEEGATIKASATKTTKTNPVSAADPAAPTKKVTRKKTDTSLG